MSALYQFDRHPYLKHSNAPAVEVKPIQILAGKFHVRIQELDNHQLAAIYMSIEAEHVNRMAVLAGYVEELDTVF